MSPCAVRSDSGDVHRVLDAASSYDLRRGRTVLHALPTGFSLDAQNHIVDPAGMIGERLGADLHVVTSEAAAARLGLMLAVERCHLGVEAVIATPHAAGLSALVDDEADMGCAVVDMGGGTTSVGIFSNGHLVHSDAIAVGGHRDDGHRARSHDPRLRRRAAQDSTAPRSLRARTTRA